MALRSKAYGAAVGLMFVVGPLAYARGSVAVRHPHVYKEGLGTLTFEDAGLTYQETGKQGPKHSWFVKWVDMQQLWVSPAEIRVTTYTDQRWQLGRDREFRVLAAAGEAFTAWMPELKGLLGVRLAMAAGAPMEAPVWQVPVKLRKGFGGSEGVLQIGRDSVVYVSEERSESRTWSLADIENVASGGPFELTLTTFERAKLAYGDRKEFHFQLKDKLDERQFNALWRRLHDAKQLEYLSEIKEGR